MSRVERRSLFASASLVAAASLVLVVALSRIAAAVLGPGESYAVAALAMAMTAAGAGAAALLPSIAAPFGLHRRLSRLLLASAGIAAIAVIFFAYLFTKKTGIRLVLPLASGAAPSGSALWAAVGVAAAAPFFLSGAAACAAARATAQSSAWLGFAWLTGSSAGCLAAIAATRAGAPRAMLGGAVLLALAALALALGARTASRLGRGPRVLLGPASTMAIGLSVVLAGDVGAPWLHMGLDPGTTSKADATRWSELGVVSVDKPSAGRSRVREDRADVAPMLDDRAQPGSEIEDLAYVLHGGKGRAVIVDAGGGRDVRAARKAGHEDVVAVVLHPSLARLIAGPYAPQAGGAFDATRVRLAVGDGRGDPVAPGQTVRVFVVRTVDELGAIELPHTGGLGYARARLRTPAALARALERLDESGTLIVTGPSAGFDALVADVEAALREEGAADPRAHVLACGNKDEVAVLAKRTPLSPADLRALRKHVKQQKLDELAAPDRRDDAAVAAARSSASADLPLGGAGLRGLLALLRDASSGRLARVAAFAVVVALSGLLALLSTGIARGPAPLRRRASALVASSVVGLSLGFVEIALARELSELLGHPVFGLSVVLPALLSALALGSLVSARVGERDVPSAFARRGVAAAVITIALGVALRLGGPWLDALAAWPRLGLALGMLVVVGAAQGGLLPLGTRLAAAIAPSLAAWSFGLWLAGRVAGLAAGGLLLAASGFGPLLVAASALLMIGAAAADGARAARHAADRARGPGDALPARGRGG
jgi:hypothetical protein